MSTYPLVPPVRVGMSVTNGTLSRMLRLAAHWAGPRAADSGPRVGGVAQSPVGPGRWRGRRIRPPAILALGSNDSAMALPR